MLNKIKKFLGMEHEIDSIIFRRALACYPYGSDSSGSYLPNITRISATEKNGTVRVIIRTHRPGILIGAKGKQISEIKQMMEQMSKKTVEIHIEEETMFSNLYD